MEKTYTKLLMAVMDGGENDWGTLVERIEEWDLDVFDIVGNVIDSLEDGKCPNINQIMFEVYRLHSEDIKEYIKDIAEDLEDLCEKVYFDEDKLSEYEVEIAVDGMASEYNNSYSFWDTKNMYELMRSYLDEVIEFLVEEEIVEVDGVCQDKGKDCDEIKASIKFLQAICKKEGIK